MSELSYISRMNLWLKERFPVMNFISGFFLYFLAKAIVTIDQHLLSVNYTDFFAMLIPACHLFLLRVLDEHKDFKSDAIYYPQRVIQRGIFKLSEVKNLGWLAFFIQVTSYLIARNGIVSDLAFVSLWFWTGLMFKEFFCADYLKKNLFLYGFLHLLVTPLLLFSLLVLKLDSFDFNQQLILPLLISVMTGWLYELSRKIKGIDEEAGDQTYSTLWGINRALVVLFLSSAVTILLTLIFFNVLGIFSLYLAVLGALLLILNIVCILFFKKNTNKKARKINEGMTLLISLYAFFPPIIFALLVN